MLLSRVVQESWNLHLEDQLACRGPRGVGLTATDDLREEKTITLEGIMMSRAVVEMLHHNFREIKVVF